jgi:outer membrane receptor protein involved in Fe transport
MSYRGFSAATIRLGVNNVFDKEPPLSTSTGAVFGNGNTYPQVYDALGRFIFARVTFDY